MTTQHIFQMGGDYPSSHGSVKNGTIVKERIVLEGPILHFHEWKEEWHLHIYTIFSKQPFLVSIVTFPGGFQTTKDYLSHEKNPGCLGYIGDYTTQIYTYIYTVYI